MSMQIKAALAILLVVFAITVVNYVSSRYIVTRSLLATMEQEQTLTRDLANDRISTHINLLKSNATTVAERLLKVPTQDEML
jgi:hypothetical protein